MKEKHKPVSVHLKDIEFEKHCIYPLNDGNPYLFCGKETNGEKYCEEHKHIVYTEKYLKNR